MALSAGAAEYIDGISAVECPGSDTKQSDSDAPVMPERWRNAEYPFMAIAPRSTVTQSGSTW